MLPKLCRQNYRVHALNISVCLCFDYIFLAHVFIFYTCRWKIYFVDRLFVLTLSVRNFFFENIRRTLRILGVGMIVDFMNIRFWVRSTLDIKTKSFLKLILLGSRIILLPWRNNILNLLKPLAVLTVFYWTGFAHFSLSLHFSIKRFPNYFGKFLSLLFWHLQHHVLCEMSHESKVLQQPHDIDFMFI